MGERRYFYQSEILYDPPNQASDTSAPGVNGWASYKMAEDMNSRTEGRCSGLFWKEAMKYDSYH
jgi:hypothetical protein